MRQNRSPVRSPLKAISQEKQPEYALPTVKVSFTRVNVFMMIKSMTGIDKQTTLSPDSAAPTEIDALKDKLSHALEGIQAKSSKLTVHDLRRLLFRCAATIIAMENASCLFSSFVKKLITLLRRTTIYFSTSFLYHSE
jgi:superfamily II RNA helicase